MSILIKGMNIPECCVLCSLFQSDEDGGFCRALKMYMYWDVIPNGRRKDCPIEMIVLDDEASVIRCKDCKAFSRIDTWQVTKEHKMSTRSCSHGLSMNPDGYCHRAERKDDAETE